MISIITGKVHKVFKPTMFLAILSIVAITFVILCSSSSAEFELSIVHFNDMHVRFEEISQNGGQCKSKNCVGGFSRLHLAVNDLVKERPNSIVLNAGDNFQGTLWYNLYKWNATQHFLNYLKVDATTLGNHEFDDNIEGLIPFMEKLKSPIIVSNIDAREEPEFQRLFNKSIVIERDGKRIGVVGVITTSTPKLATPMQLGKLKFLDEIDSVNTEAERLVAEENVDTIIVLSHCGYELDKKLAENAAPKIGLIVGAHSHTFLYTGTSLPGPDIPSGPYPTIVMSQNRTKVVIVQASAYTKYLGNITIRYDNNGEPISWEGAPIYLNSTIPKDPVIEKEISKWKVAVDAVANRVIGSSQVLLDVNSCVGGECLMGNLITDVMVESVLNMAKSDEWTFASIAFMNSPGLRASIDPGEINYSDLIISLPFANRFLVGEIQGKFLKQALEFSAKETSYFNGLKTVTNPLQVSGLRVVYNVSQPFGNRVESLKVRCRVCDIPMYEEIDLDEIYRVVTGDYLIGGGDGFTFLTNNFKILTDVGVDVEVVEEYIKRRSPIVQEIQDRIEIIE